MKNQLGFRKLLASVGLLTIVVPSSISTITYNSKFDATNVVTKIRNFDATNSEEIVSAINGIIYFKEVSVGTKVVDLKSTINPQFMKSLLNSEYQDSFRNELFNLNKITNMQEQEITNGDLASARTMFLKIYYSYGDFTNQQTNLILTIKEGLLELSEVFKDFYFTEQKGTEGFLDSVDQQNIAKQIEQHLNESLTSAGLILENQQATSIVLKAKTNSSTYQGEVKLTWNLKLFEITGQPLLSSPDRNVYEGIKAFIYLDHQDQQIKVFDYPGYRNARTVVGYANGWMRTHRFNFVNDRGGNFTFNVYSRDLTSSLPGRFRGFDFANGVQVTLTTSWPPYYIGVFKKEINGWDTASKRTYFIDFLGNVH